jgi:hypothetical protein
MSLVSNRYWQKLRAIVEFHGIPRLLSSYAQLLGSGRVVDDMRLNFLRIFRFFVRVSCLFMELHFMA